jgi:aminoglycoside phosphotransferase (APT) family kinase protein
VREAFARRSSQHTPNDAMHIPTHVPDCASTQGFVQALRRMGLLARDAAAPPLIPLAGGVSSDIVRADLPGGPICLKRALPKLKVRADWQAPIERNRWEVEWMRVAASIEPAAVPRVLGEDPECAMFAMEFLDPSRYAVWKARLLEGDAVAAFAGRVGSRIASIHAHTAHRTDLAQAFATDHIFFPIRLEPYLAATARAHPDLAPQLQGLIDITGRTKLGLVHGDVSPKNILCGPDGPVFLDAECAWYGDPAFDLAFCLNHMLLKCIWRPQSTPGYLACFDALASSYLEGVAWESKAGLEARTAHLLPGLLLARVDGKSPVEYITHEFQKSVVRNVARRFLAQPSEQLADLAQAWREAIAQSQVSSN